MPLGEAFVLVADLRRTDRDRESRGDDDAGGANESERRAGRQFRYFQYR